MFRSSVIEVQNWPARRYLHDVSHQESVRPNNLDSLQGELSFESLSSLRRFYKYQEKSRNWANTPHCVVDTNYCELLGDQLCDFLNAFRTSVCDWLWTNLTSMGISHLKSVGPSNSNFLETVGPSRLLLGLLVDKGWAFYPSVVDSVFTTGGLSVPGSTRTGRILSSSNSSSISIFFSISRTWASLGSAKKSISSL